MSTRQAPRHPNIEGITMSLVQRMRDHFARAPRGDFIKRSIEIDRGVAYHLVPMIERMATGTHEAWCLLNAARQFFIDDRPLISIVKGDEIRMLVEGPEYTCDGTIYPLGAQVFVDKAGWLNLGPVEALDLQEAIRRAIDVAAFRWLSEHSKLGMAAPFRMPRDRPIDDEIALRQMAAAAGPDHRDGEPADA
ncbi:MAG: hypothetical protein KGM18_02945 [Sphingomonadales bacterium]|nr:hypothetical protein [Sphingomonadales bacterium]